VVRRGNTVTPQLDQPCPNPAQPSRTANANAERERLSAASECDDHTVALPTADQLRAFAQRDWSAHSKIVPVVNDSASAIALSEMLCRHMREIDPCWPDPVQRHSDLEHHLHFESLKQRINKVLFPR
jgi:hypothetical protein